MYILTSHLSNHAVNNVVLIPQHINFAVNAEANNVQMWHYSTLSKYVLFYQDGSSSYLLGLVLVRLQWYAYILFFNNAF